MLEKVFVAHIIFACIYLWKIASKPRDQFICESIIVFLMPILGMAFLLVLRLSGKWKKQEDPSYMYSEFAYEQMLLKAVSVDEANIIPIVDVLLMDDVRLKRAILSDAVKRNVLNNNEILRKAIKDQDSEIKHYAVSLLTHKIAEIETIFYQLRREVQEIPQNSDVLRRYIDIFEIYLKVSVLDEITREQLKRDCAAKLGNLLAIDRTEKKYFIQKIDYEIDLGNYNEAEKYCKLFQETFAETEESYLMYTKVYYYLKDHHKMQKAIQKLKASKIELSNRALQLIRFWDGSGTYVS